MRVAANLLVALALALAGTSNGRAFHQPTVAKTEIVGQFHGDPVTAVLRQYLAGNQFVAMGHLVARFQQLHPESTEAQAGTVDDLVVFGEGATRMLLAGRLTPFS
jgi:hypothetical protein